MLLDWLPAVFFTIFEPYYADEVQEDGSKSNVR